MKIVESLDDLIARYGAPYYWDWYTRLINGARLLNEEMAVRVILDIATRCPDEAGRQRARAKFGADVDIEKIDLEWPGRNDFTYDWEALIAGDAAEESVSI